MSRARSMLRVVGAAPRLDAAVVAFCGHCGRPPEHETAARVCTRCGLGVLLHAHPTVAPRPSDPFLVVDTMLAVCAMSAHAEELLGTSETRAVNRHVTDFLVPADAEAPSSENLLATLIAAAGADGPPRTVVVRPTDEFGVRFAARVGSCGPPHAALLVLGR